MLTGIKFSEKNKKKKDLKGKNDIQKTRCDTCDYA